MENVELRRRAEALGIPIKPGWFVIGWDDKGNRPLTSPTPFPPPYDGTESRVYEPFPAFDDEYSLPPSRTSLNMKPGLARFAAGIKFAGSPTTMNSTPSQPSAPSPSSAMRLEAVAHDFGCTPLAVRRLIARGRLKAVVLGSDYRVLASDAARYISSGAADFNHPPLTERWFSETETRPGEAMLGKLQAAVQAVRLDAAGVASKAQGLSEITATVNASPALAAIFNAKPDAGAFKMPGTKPSRFATGGDCYLVGKVRDAARRIINERAGEGSEIERLYSSPYAYRAYAMKAADAVLSQNYTLSEMVKIGDPTHALKSRDVRVIYAVPNRLMSRLTAAQLVDLAF